MPEKSQRVDVLGVGISALNLESAKKTILERLKKREKGYICVTGVHGVIEAQDDSKFRNILNESFLTTPDGMPIIGPVDGMPGVFVAAGHEGLGITTATGTGLLIASMATGSPPPIDPTPYRVHRFSAGAA